MLTMQKNISLVDTQATLTFGAQLAKQLQPGQLIFLNGDLGAGKTTLARGMLHALGHIGKVKSPTFTLVETYPLDQFMLYHFDLYRLENIAAWEALGFRDYLNQTSICLIEWAVKGKDFLPNADLTINIEITNTARYVTIS